MPVQRICARCATPFTTIPSRVLDGRGVYCSRKCIGTSPLSDEARFSARVARGAPDACWPWTGYRDRRGYGAFPLGNTHIGAHRFAWILANGPIPAGLVVMHRCDVPACCNPAHLRIGTQTENNADKYAKGRQARGDRHGSRTRPGARLRGEAVHWSRLTTDAVREMRRLHAEGHSASRLGRMFGVSHETTRNVVLRKSWAHVE